MEKLDAMMSVNQWKRVEVDDGGKKKSVTRIVEVNMEKEKYVDHFEAQMSEFETHIGRMKNQYEQMRNLKSDLPDHNM
ncbi:hypothetical protein DPMN_170141 [Dreissena polymorpha]|uniref:Uncharacterized protein n=1 Tax=Dreissena polymorpha TaxID=45954 RepID=A0A9D4DWT4_DREPO|nr:hypothetical protein DPMN_170141 [Dreissena polymorpha]